MRTPTEKVAGVYGCLVLWGTLAEVLNWWFAAAGALLVAGLVIWRPVVAVRAGFLALLLVVHVRWCLLDWMIVEGPSMQPTLPAGSIAFVLKRGILPPVTPFMHREGLRRVWTRVPENGKAVIVRYPGLDSPAPSRVVKRIAAGPGDNYEFRESGLFVNDALIKTGITHAPRRLQPPPAQVPALVAEAGPLAEYAAAHGVPARATVPAGMVLVIGDNPDDSRDSRSIGFVPLSFIEGDVFASSGGAGVSDAQ